MPRLWSHEFKDGTTLVKSNRTEPVNIKLEAQEIRLLMAEALHYKQRLAAQLVWALEEFAKRGVALGAEQPDLSVGMKRPRKRISRSTKVSVSELKLWDELVARYGVGRGRVAVMALIELYKREPVDLTIAMLQRRAREE